MKKEQIVDFLLKNDYDVRKTGDARWIDQKCTSDVLSMIADCILDYNENNEREFTIKDIWNSDYARDNVIQIFSKPDTQLKEAENEYDKYFGQPIKLFGYSKLLNVRKEKKRYFYSVKEKEILEFIALRPMNALSFLNEYIKKVLKDSGIYDKFVCFFEKQDKESFKKMKEEYFEFIKKYTKINQNLECGRIFSKILNPLAFSKRKKGTIRGNLSKNVIKLEEIQYNRVNWRDEYTGKEKSVVRKSIEIYKRQKLEIYEINKAIRYMKKYNKLKRYDVSEIIQENEKQIATQIHHIFSKTEFPSIAAHLENLIALTPNQHFLMAHPQNNTKYIDKDFQYICLLAKSKNIRESLLIKKEEIYDFERYKEVLNTGLRTKEFLYIKENDFLEIIQKIDIFYSDYIKNNKFSELIEKNYPRI